MKPFVGMFGLTNRAIAETGGVFEPASRLAFIVYLLAGLFVGRLLTAPLLPPPRRWTVFRR